MGTDSSFPSLAALRAPRSLLRNSTDQKLHCAGCNAVHNLGIDHCPKHDGHKYGKGPQKCIHR
jgi:hypothetical protein